MQDAVIRHEDDVGEGSPDIDGDADGFRISGRGRNHYIPLPRVDIAIAAN
jgi:hypothetical protein